MNLQKSTHGKKIKQSKNKANITQTIQHTYNGVADEKENNGT